MSHHLAQLAVSAAIASNWEEAQEINKAILEDNPEDIDALNRLAKAYGELAKIKEALAASKKVLSFDPENKIALKAMIKWKARQKTQKLPDFVKMPAAKQSSEMFLEEPGKTKIIPLINLGDKKLISLLDSGDIVAVSVSGRRVTIHALDGKYLGRLPDNIAAHLKRLIELGCEYEAFVKTALEKEVKIFLRETKRGPKVKGITSFPTEKINYVPHAKSAPQNFYPE